MCSCVFLCVYGMFVCINETIFKVYKNLIAQPTSLLFGVVYQINDPRVTNNHDSEIIRTK